MCQNAIAAAHATTATRGRRRNERPRRSHPTRASGRSTNGGRRKSTSGPRTASIASAGARSPISTCWSMCAEIRYWSPEGSSGETSASVPIATAAANIGSRVQGAWSARPRRRSRTNAWAKRTSASPANARTSGSTRHVDASSERGTGVCASAAAGRASAASASAAVVRSRRLLAGRGTLELLAELRVGLLPVRPPADVPVRVDHVEGRQRLHPVLLRDRPGDPRLAEGTRPRAGIEERREAQSVVAVVREDAARILAVRVDRHEGVFVGRQRARELLQVRRLGVAEPAPGGEELEQHRLPAQRRELQLLALRRSQREVGRGRALVEQDRRARRLRGGRRLRLDRAGSGL